MRKNDNLFLIIIVILVIGSICILAPSEYYKSYKINRYRFLSYITGAEIGVDNTVKIGITPVRVSVFNNDYSFSGVIQVLLYTDDKHFITHSKEIYMKRSAIEDFVIDIPIETININKNVIVSLIKDGKVIHKVERKVKEVIGPETTLIGVIANNGTDLNYLNAIKLPALTKDTNDNREASNEKNPVKIIKLSRNHVFEGASSYRYFNVLLLLEYSDLMSYLPYDTITYWVRNGGVLIENRSAFENWLINKESEIISENIDTLCQYVGEESPISNLPLTSGTNLRGEKVLDFKGKVLVASNKDREGITYDIAFDLTKDPFLNWKGNAKFVEKLLQSEIERIRENDYSNRYSYIEGQDSIAKKYSNYLVLLNIILVIVVLIVGLILFILLKKKNNWELNWVVIPVTVVVVAVGIHEIRYKTSIVNDVTVIELRDQERKARRETELTIYSNNKKVEFEGGSSFAWKYIKNEGYDSKESAKEKLEHRVFYGERTIMEMLNAGISKPKKVGFNDLTDNYAIDLSGRLYEDYIDVKISNGSKLKIEDAFLVYGQQVYQLDDINNYTKRNFKLPIENGISIGEYLSKMYKNTDKAIGKEHFRKIIESKIYNDDSDKIFLFFFSDDKDNAPVYNDYYVNWGKPKINSTVIYIRDAKLNETID